jgi:hypothetical protein
MKVFLSWSGDRAKAVAVALDEWLPLVIQSLKPFISTNIPKGARGLDVIGGELEDTRIGIVCVTPEGKNSPWLIFEAGALSKTRTATHVCTYLIGMKNTELEPPLGQFQWTQAEKDDTFKLMTTINNAQGDTALKDAPLRTVFDRFWPDLNLKIQAAIAIPTAVAPPRRPEREILEEILSVVREQQTSASREAARAAFLRGAEPGISNLARFLTTTSSSGPERTPAMTDILLAIQAIEAANTKEEVALRFARTALKDAAAREREAAGGATATAADRSRAVPEAPPALKPARDKEDQD